MVARGGVFVQSSSQVCSGGQARVAKLTSDLWLPCKTCTVRWCLATRWDITFWAERLREARYNINEEELRPYFALPDVLTGLFGVAKRLFGVDIVPADGQAPIWHSDVRFFKVRCHSSSAWHQACFISQDIVVCAGKSVAYACVSV